MPNSRPVTINNLGVGFSVQCETCPVLDVLRKLELPTLFCVNGIFTNMQGAVATEKCQFYEDLIDGPLVVCRYKGDACE